MSEKASEGPSCWDKALDLLSRRSHFERELDRKLRTRGYGSEEVESTMERLRERGFVDDERSAREFVRSKRARGGVGVRKLRADLERRGVVRDVVDDVLAPISDQDEIEDARNVALRWLRFSGREPAALGRHLDRKGFSQRAILTILEEREDLLANEPGDL